MASASRFQNQIPKEVSLNPYFDMIALKMKDLFLKFIADPSKQSQIKELIESASVGSLMPGSFPAPLQIDSLPSFNNPGKTSLNTPPVRRRLEKFPLMSYTIGPRARDLTSKDKNNNKIDHPALMSTIDTNRNSHVVPPMKELLSICLNQGNSTLKEETFFTLINQVVIRDILLITSELAASHPCEKICRDILGINVYFARTLERKLGLLISQNRKK